jgi:hypothetical protein
MLLLVLVKVFAEKGDSAYEGEDKAWCPVKAPLFLELFVFAAFGRLLSTGLSVTSRGFRVGISPSHGDGSCGMLKRVGLYMELFL